MGYYWYWVVEYYNLNLFVGFVFEILIGCFVYEMLSMWIGLGGVMLFYYSLLKVVEIFWMLEIFIFGCIDLGIGCVFGIDGKIMVVF